MDFSFESVEILHEHIPFAQLCWATETKIVDAVSKELLPASQTKLLQAHKPKGADVYPAVRSLQEFCAAVFCFGDSRTSSEKSFLR